MLEGLRRRYPSSTVKSGLGLSCNLLFISSNTAGVWDVPLSSSEQSGKVHTSAPTHTPSPEVRGGLSPAVTVAAPALSQTGRNECPLLRAGGGKRRAMVRGDFRFLCYHHRCIRNLPLQPRRAGWQPGWQHRALQRVLVCVCEREGEGRDVRLAGNAAPRS